MKKAAKIFFIIGIVTAIITGISFTITKINENKYNTERDKYNEISEKSSKEYKTYEEIYNKYLKLYNEYENIDEEENDLYYKYLLATYRESSGIGSSENTKRLKEEWNSKMDEKNNLENECKKYKEDADMQYQKYEKCAEEKEKAQSAYNSAYNKYQRRANNALTIAIISGIITCSSVVLGIVLMILNIIKEKKGRDVFHKVLLGIGIFIISGGILASIILIIFSNLYFEEVMIVPFVCGSVGGSFIWGYITYKILNGRKNSFLWGFLLGIIGIIIAVCTRDKKKENISNGNKYEDLMKLKTLKEEGIITEEEFNKEKEKVLKD